MKSFGDVEDDIGPRLAEPLRKVFLRLEAKDFSEAGESGFNGGDRGGAVPLGELVAGD
ncbi:MAG TPA: hypothetical protein VK565_10915 [Gemmatimonadaceae bacterium]|nr:hypothetical protein [Gemmatimonadaceae bacterium]